MSAISLWTTIESIIPIRNRRYTLNWTKLNKDTSYRMKSQMEQVWPIKIEEQCIVNKTTDWNWRNKVKEDDLCGCSLVGKWTHHDERSKISADLPSLECSQCITRWDKEEENKSLNNHSQIEHSNFSLFFNFQLVFTMTKHLYL